MPAGRLVPLIAVALAVGACGAGGAGARATTTTALPATTAAPATSTSRPTTTTTSTTPPPPASTTTTTTPTTTTLVPTTTSLPPFGWSSSAVTGAELGKTWHAGCPVGPSGLRLLRMSYWGFDGRPHEGEMVVNETAVNAVVSVFSSLYAARFPLAEMVPQSAYGGNDDAAAAADDTSGFNCRYAVSSGPPHWSEHAYGLAIDVNDVQNPYVEGSKVIPPAGAAYENRGDVRPGMAVPGGILVEAFASVGWQWGGRWAATPDYQHFSASGG